MKKKFKILASGGGTISHTIPLVEVLEKLDKNLFEVLYVASNDGPEYEIIKDKFLYKKIFVGKMFRSIDLRNIINFIKNIIGIIQVKIIILFYKPDLVVCKGGYVTVPIIFWSILYNKTLIIHESDSVMGFANRMASKKAKKILTAFDKKYYPKELANKIEVCGIPLRNEFLQEIKHNTNHQHKKLLVIGGSQGAKTLNQFVTSNLEKIIDKNIHISHIWGEKNKDEAKCFYDSLDDNVKKFYQYYIFVSNNISSLINSSDLVVTRCGATIIAELSALEKAAVFVPYPYASQNHQEKNSKIIQETDSGLVIKDDQITSQIDTIIELINDKDKLKMYEKNISRLMSKNSTEKFIQVIKEIANES